MQLTNARNVEPGAAVPETVESQAATAATVRVRFAHHPAGLSIKHGDRDLLQGVDASESPVETGVELVIPKEGIEFQVTAKWPEGTPDTALTVELEELLGHRVDVVPDDSIYWLLRRRILSEARPL